MASAVGRRVTTLTRIGERWAVPPSPTPSLRAVARSRPRLGAAALAARQLGATPTRSRLGIRPLTSPDTGLGRLSGSMGESNPFRGAVSRWATGLGEGSGLGDRVG